MTDENRPPAPVPPGGTGQLVLYRTEDGQTRISCRPEGDSVWLTQAAIADLFQTTPQNITLHIGAIYQEGELREDSTCKEYLQVRQGKDDFEVSLRQHQCRIPVNASEGFHERRGVELLVDKRLYERMFDGEVAPSLLLAITSTAPSTRSSIQSGTAVFQAPLSQAESNMRIRGRSLGGDFTGMIFHRRAGSELRPEVGGLRWSPIVCKCMRNW